MAARTTKFVSQAQLTTTLTLVYTVPNTSKALVRWIQACDIGSGAPSPSWQLRLNGTADADRFVRGQSVPDSTSVGLSVYFALDPGDEIYASASANTRVSLSISGYLYAA